MRGLNFDQLRALLEVIEHGSFSAAARRLNLTQPAVSLQIRELERRFGLRLIERLGKQAHATVPGRELVEAAQRIFRECDQVDATMRRFREGWVGRVRVNMTLTAMIYRIPPILRRIRLEHPGIDLVINNTPTPTSVENIIQNRIDLALVNLPVQKKQLKTTPLCSEGMVAIFPVGTRNVPDEITPNDVAPHNLLVEQQSSAAYALVLGWLSGRAPAREPMPLGTVEALKSAVASKSRYGNRAGGGGRPAHVGFHRTAVEAGAVAHTRSHRASQQAERAGDRNRAQCVARVANDCGKRTQDAQVSTPRAKLKSRRFASAGLRKILLNRRSSGMSRLVRAPGHQGLGEFWEKISS